MVNLFTNRFSVAAGKLKKLPGNFLEEVLMLGSAYHHSIKGGVIKQ